LDHELGVHRSQPNVRIMLTVSVFAAVGVNVLAITFVQMDQLAVVERLADFKDYVLLRPRIGDHLRGEFIDAQTVDEKEIRLGDLDGVGRGRLKIMRTLGRQETKDLRMIARDIGGEAIQRRERRENFELIRPCVAERIASSTATTNGTKS